MSNITYANIPHVNKPVSRILFGTAADPFHNGEDQNELLDSIFALGINTLDTARVYGDSENSIGNWMDARGNRDDLVLLTKCGHHTPDGKKRVTPAEMKKDLAESLSRLKTDYVDILLLHRDDTSVPVGPLVETFNEMHADGKIGAFGGSNWTAARIDEANEYAYKHNLIPFVISSPNFGLAEEIVDMWGGDSLTLSGEKMHRSVNGIKKHRLPPSLIPVLEEDCFPAG